MTFPRPPALHAAIEDVVPHVTALLPTRADMLERLDRVIPTTEIRPAALLLIGLVHGESDPPLTSDVLARATTLLARRSRGTDWLALAGSAEFAVVCSGTAAGAETSANRLLGALQGEAVPSVSAAAGIAAIGPRLSAAEVLSRATVCLTSARATGPGRIVNYGGTR